LLHKLNSLNDYASPPVWLQALGVLFAAWPADTLATPMGMAWVPDLGLLVVDNYNNK
jgi:hypothetical protein